MEPMLINLQKSFSAWRGLSSKKCQTNVNLRQEAVKCLDYYSYKEVSAAIGMHVKTLQSWKKSLHSDQKITDTAPEFVSMNFDSTKNQDIDEVAKLEFSLQISLPSGIKIQVSASNIKSSAALIVALNQESNACSI